MEVEYDDAWQSRTKAQSNTEVSGGKRRNDAVVFT